MQIIQSIEVRKFRSIKWLGYKFIASDMTILVGQNDNGKSNILRALNLFFNGETDRGQLFRFEDDYCYHADSGTGTRKEVRIDIVINPPSHRFKNARPVKWVKQWKRDGSVVEGRYYLSDGKELSRSENISKWMDKIAYRYVPAVKGKEYFNSLMGELYDVLNEAHSDVLKNQSSGFIGGIQKITKDITKELTSQIGMPNTIQVPSDFKVLFSNLDFGAQIGERTYHLKQRGDGIKVRHIPVILKYMADHAKNVSIPGYVKPDTIWGFEEPENNLELKFAFEMADKFLEYSSDIQIFITTHSPAFYAIDDSGRGVTKYLVEMDSDTKCTGIARISSESSELVHEKMGLLPLITPYIEEAYKHQLEIVQLQKKLDAISKKKSCFILTEDNNSSAFMALLKANYFDLDDVEIVTYNGKDQISGAILLAKYLQSKSPDIAVLIHRDRDYHNDNELANIEDRVTKNGFDFFVTNGVDIESHFLNKKHLLELFSEIDEQTIEDIIEEATAESRQKSIDKAIDHFFKINKPKDYAYAKTMHQIADLYDSDVNRYRYGKTVLGLVKNKIANKLKRHVDLFVPSAHLRNEKLLSFCDKVWGVI